MNYVEGKRGKLPKETLMISGNPYWLKEKAEWYIVANKRQTLMSLSFRFTIDF